jgi:hypothetical protein
MFLTSHSKKFKRYVAVWGRQRTKRWIWWTDEPANEMRNKSPTAFFLSYWISMHVALYSFKTVGHLSTLISLFLSASVSVTFYAWSTNAKMCVLKVSSPETEYKVSCFIDVAVRSSFRDVSFYRLCFQEYSLIPFALLWWSTGPRSYMVIPNQIC